MEFARTSVSFTSILHNREKHKFAGKLASLPIEASFYLNLSLYFHDITRLSFPAICLTLCRRMEFPERDLEIKLIMEFSFAATEHVEGHVMINDCKKKNGSKSAIQERV